MILITGASGFLGQHLLRRLASPERKVRALYNTTAPSAALQNLPGTEWLQCDLLDVFAVEEAFEDITEVYHCAAFVSFDPAHKAMLFQQNVNGTENIVDAALNAGIRKMVAVSSVASLGRAATRQAFITEEADWEESNRNSAYSVSKYYAEMEVWRGIGEGLNAVIVNPGIILGEGNWNKGSTKLIKIVDREFPYYTEGVNAWVDVQDVVAVMEMLMQSGISAERYIISAGNFPYRDVFSKMAVALGRKPPGIKASPIIAALVARLSMLKSWLSNTEPTLTRETARTAGAQCFYDNSKLLKDLPGFSYLSLETTIERMATAYRHKEEARNWS